MVRRRSLLVFPFFTTAARSISTAGGSSRAYGGNVGAVGGATETVCAAGTCVASVVGRCDEGDGFRMDGAVCAGAGAFGGGC